MDKLREAAVQMLEELEIYFDAYPHMQKGYVIDAITDLRAALAEQPAEQPAEQKPFGYLWPTGTHPEFRFTQQERNGVDGMPVYTAPQPRLIAAAPELLAALESIASMYDYEAACGDLASRLYEATCLARTAIAKATGETK